jgi:hypothetical protein
MIPARALCRVSLLVLVVALAGCGSSIPASTPSGASAGSMSGVTTGSHGILRTAPAPLPAGTPAAPSGLARTGGYGTYELCRAHCSGAVPRSMRRALHLPAVHGAQCPAASASTGEVSVTGSGSESAERFVGSKWLAVHVTWRAAPGYRGPILIRGRRLGGRSAVGFGEGRRPYDELQLMRSGRGAPASAAGGGRAWLTLTRVRTPGCYAYQIDGTSFSNVIVFRVRARAA